MGWPSPPMSPRPWLAASFAGTVPEDRSGFRIESSCLLTSPHAHFPQAQKAPDSHLCRRQVLRSPTAGGKEFDGREDGHRVCGRYPKARHRDAEEGGQGAGGDASLVSFQSLHTACSPTLAGTDTRSAVLRVRSSPEGSRHADTCPLAFLSASRPRC